VEATRLLRLSISLHSPAWLLSSPPSFYHSKVISFIPPRDAASNRQQVYRLCAQQVLGKSLPTQCVEEKAQRSTHSCLQVSTQHTGQWKKRLPNRMVAMCTPKTGLRTCRADGQCGILRGIAYSHQGGQVTATCVNRHKSKI
jgi:hypothetical protein